MATLSLNPARLRSPNKPFFRKPTSSLLPLCRPSSVPSHRALRRTGIRHSSIFCRSSLSESSASPLTEDSPLEDDAEQLEEEEDDDDDPTTEVCYLDPDADAEAITEWEMDFCSRPILDARGKKLWELVVCDGTLSLQYTRYFPNNVINSVTLKEAILTISDTLGVPLPEKIRFFRSQMQTIITRACNELSVKPIPSKRCVSLVLWLEERYETIYTRHPGFQKGTKPLLALDNPFPMQLPENLFGEKWAFVQLPFSALQEEMSSLDRKYAFGSDLDLDLLGLEIDDKTLVPGLAVASSRAKPLAAWTNGLEVSSVEVDIDRASLILSTGVATRYVYATIHWLGIWFSGCRKKSLAFRATSASKMASSTISDPLVSSPGFGSNPALSADTGRMDKRPKLSKCLSPSSLLLKSSDFTDVDSANFAYIIAWLCTLAESALKGPWSFNASIVGLRQLSICGEETTSSIGLSSVLSSFLVSGPGFRSDILLTS